MAIQLKTERRRLLIVYAVTWIVCSMLLYLSVRLLIMFSGDIVGLIDSSLSNIFSAWKKANVDTPILLIILFGAALAGVKCFCFSADKTKSGARGAVIRVFTVIVLIILFFAGFALTLWLTRINSIPVYVLAEIIPDLVGAL